MKTVLIVGLGKISFSEKQRYTEVESFVTHTQAFNSDSFFTLAGSVEINPNVRKQFEKIYNKPSFENISEGLSVLQPDLVLISVPTPSHFQMLHSVLESKIPSLVLCEKPLSLNDREYETIKNLSQSSGTDIFVNYLRRSWPGIEKIKNNIIKGNIDSPMQGVVWYSKGLKNSCSHFTDLMAFLLGPVQKSRSIGPIRKLNETDVMRDIHITFERGEITFLGCSSTDLFHNSFELISSSGRLVGLNGGRTICWNDAIADPLYEGYRILNETPTIIQNQFSEHLKYIPRELENWFKHGKTNLTSLDESFSIESILEKLATELPHE